MNQHPQKGGGRRAHPARNDRPNRPYLKPTDSPPAKPTRYRTVLVDPPWDVHQRGNFGAIQHYPLMSLEAIKDLPIPTLAADEAHVWLWATNASLPFAFEVIAAWGFTYRSCLTWIKPRLGLGCYLRNQTEQCLLGTRGNAPVLFRSQGTWLYAPQQEHSHKPEEQYAVIERCSSGPYLELFARRHRPGWDVWGNEINSTVALPPETPMARDGTTNLNGTRQHGTGSKQRR